MHPQSTAIMGVYAITHVPSGRQYVGSSIDVPRRMREHVYRLEHTKRPPPLMRADWMRDGADAFVFEVLERVGDEADLERAERRWAARLKPIYNRLRPYRPSRRGKKAERAPRTHGYADWPSYFWSRMDRSGGFFTCWCWSGGLNACGYGTIRYKGRTWVAHRLAWTLANGPIPVGLNCLHRCDVRSCCNPAHLFLGTQSENVMDMVAKKRHCVPFGDEHWLRRAPERALRGEASGASKLTCQQVLEIRRAYAAGGVTSVALGRHYGVTDTLVRAIVHRQIWTHVPAEEGTFVPSHPRSPLSADDVRAMRLRYAAGERASALAAEFAIGAGSVSRIARRERWAGLSD